MAAYVNRTVLMITERTDAIGSLTGHSICVKVLCVCFLNLCFIFFLFAYNIENKACHIHVFLEDCKGGLYRDSTGKPIAQSADSENSSPSRRLT